jgi:uroporphyrinogen-III synthase
LAPPGQDRPLAGFTIAITADRRRDEFAALLERRGARILLAPALRIAPIGDDSEVYARTAELVAHPPSIVVASTGIGVRGWLEAAEGWGLAEPLRAALGGAYVIARGPKARGAVRAAGLTEQWSPESENGEEMLAHLLARGIAGERIAVQLHGEDQADFLESLRAAGAEVVPVGVYQWAPPVDPAPLRRLVDLISAAQVDAVTFTSAPAVEALLDAAGPQADAVVAALRRDVLAASVGPVTSKPLRERDIPVVEPTRARLGTLARTLVDELPRRSPTLTVAGRELALRGHAAVVDGEIRPVPQASMGVLRALVAARGRVLSRTDILAGLPRGADEHAAEMAVARLRTALGGNDLIQTVMKRGYRLRIDAD